MLKSFCCFLTTKKKGFIHIALLNKTHWTHFYYISFLIKHLKSLLSELLKAETSRGNDKPVFKHSVILSITRTCPFDMYIWWNVLHVVPVS